MSDTQNMELDDHITAKYEIKKRLGKGAYGIVWKAVNRKTNEVVALKKIFDAFQNQVDAQRTYREIMFLKAFRNHPNIIKLQDVHKAKNNKDIYLIFDFMDTDLHKVIQNKNILKDIHKRFIMYQLLKATMYMHSGNVIHRDQKPSNILLDINCKCKIADFGLARSLSQLSECEEGDPPLTDYVATRWYRAPEILIGSTRYTKGIDMWSLGCILAEMLLEHPLFPGGSSIKQLELIMKTLPQPSREDLRMLISTYGGSKLFSHQNIGRSQSLSELLSGSPPEAIDLVEKLLVLNPQKRLTAAEALKHPYVSRFHSLETEPSLQQPVMPPLSDNTMLSVEEYRTKLYELSSSNSLTPLSKRKSHRQQSAPENSAASSNSVVVPKRRQSKPNRTVSMEEKVKPSKSKSSLNAPPADWQDRRASLPKRLPQDKVDSTSAIVKVASTKPNPHLPFTRKASLPILPQGNKSSQPPAPERAKLSPPQLPKASKWIDNRQLIGGGKRQFSNKGNQSSWTYVANNSKEYNIRNNSATVKCSALQKIFPHIC